MMVCNKCKYSWENRVQHPKECPRCKSRIDTDDNKDWDKSKEIYI